MKWPYLICIVLMLIVTVQPLRAQENSSAQNSNPALTSTNLSGPMLYKQMSLMELMNQDVTSVAKEPEPYGKAPAAISVITSDEIESSGASSIPEALRLADNLDVAQKNSHDWAISARGFNTALANKLLVLIDGRTVYTPLFAGVFWDQQDYLLKDIDRIEVISGPGGTLWGANAVNGVINIVTKDAADTQGLYVEGGGGSELRDFGGARYGGVIASNIYYRVYGKYFDRNDEDLPNGDDASDSWRTGQGGFRIDDDAVADNHLTAQGDFYLGDENMPTGDDAHTGGGNILGRWSHTFSDDSDMSLQTYYERTHLADPIPANATTGEPAGFLMDDLDTYDLDFQHRFHLGGRNNVVWGLGYRFTHEVDQSAPALGFEPSTLNQNLFNGFAQDEIMLLKKKLFFTLGTKIEHNDYTGFEFEPSARLQWNATPKQMFWAAVSRAVRTPSRVERDERAPFAPPTSAIFPNLLTGSSDFDSETLIAYELGYRAQLGQKISTSVSAFYNDYDDIRSTGFTPTTFFPFVFQNNLEGDTYGVELSADYQLFSWWRLHGGYDLLKENIHTKHGGTDINNALNETADPQQQFQIRSTMELPKNIELEAAFRWVDSFTYNNNTVPGTVPGYYELSARIAWRPTKNWELSIVGQNLLHDRHLEYISPSPAPQEEIVRAVYAKVSFNF